MQQLLFQHSVPALERPLKTFLRSMPADIELLEIKESILSLELRMILELLRLNMTIANVIMLFRASDMI
jgi:hypothetical protein